MQNSVNARTDHKRPDNGWMDRQTETDRQLENIMPLAIYRWWQRHKNVLANVHNKHSTSKGSDVVAVTCTSTD